MFQLLSAGLALGFVSSMHCVGMCGPLALALPVSHLSPKSRTAAVYLYHAGRVSTYAMLGIIFGLVGRGFYLAGWQQAFSVATGVTMLLAIIFYFGLKRHIRLKWLDELNRAIQKSMGYFLAQKNYGSYFFLGLANGLLPCGMVYMAIGAALVTGNTLHSALFMAVFGLATVPAMLLVTGIGRNISLLLRNKLKRITPFIMALVALLLIVRGITTNLSYPGKAYHHAGQPLLCQ